MCCRCGDILRAVCVPLLHDPRATRRRGHRRGLPGTRPTRHTPHATPQTMRHTQPTRPAPQMRAGHPCERWQAQPSLVGWGGAQLSLSILVVTPSWFLSLPLSRLYLFLSLTLTSSISPSSSLHTSRHARTHALLRASRPVRILSRVRVMAGLLLPLLVMRLVYDVLKPLPRGRTRRGHARRSCAFCSRGAFWS